jgi:hypothetical protein
VRKDSALNPWLRQERGSSPIVREDYCTANAYSDRVQQQFTRASEAAYSATYEWLHESMRGRILFANYVARSASLVHHRALNPQLALWATGMSPAARAGRSQSAVAATSKPMMACSQSSRGLHWPHAEQVFSPSPDPGFAALPLRCVDSRVNHDRHRYHYQFQ